MSEQILWLARQHIIEAWYTLYDGEPQDDMAGWVVSSDGEIIGDFSPTLIDKFCPTLTLKPGEKCKVKLTTTDGGIRLEKM